VASSPQSLEAEAARVRDNLNLKLKDFWVIPELLIGR
jgi:hypothetical protein